MAPNVGLVVPGVRGEKLPEHGQEADVTVGEPLQEEHWVAWKLCMLASCPCANTQHVPQKLPRMAAMFCAMPAVWTTCTAIQCEVSMSSASGDRMVLVAT